MDAELKTYLDGMVEAISINTNATIQRMEERWMRIDRLAQRMDRLEQRMDRQEGLLESLRAE